MLKRDTIKILVELKKDTYYGLKVIKDSYKSKSWPDFFDKLVFDVIGDTRDLKTIIKEKKVRI